MVIADLDYTSNSGSILLRPNHLLSWKGNLWFLFLLSCLSLTIATSLMIAGAYLILPFSLLEILALAAALYYCAWQRQRREVITFSAYQVTIEKGYYQPQQTRRYHRLWAQFIVRQPAHPWEPHQVCIRSHGKEEELGTFLSREDKKRLITQLRRFVQATQKSL